MNLLNVIKYISIMLIVAIILYVIPGEKLEMKYIVMVAFGAAVFSCILDLLVRWYIKGKLSENFKMEYVEAPKRYHLSTEDQDYANTGLKYDNDLPGYYLINNGQFSDGKIPYSEADDMIIESKLHDLYNQQNFNIVTSPHTHMGKNRGHFNWDPVYE